MVKRLMMLGVMVSVFCVIATVAIASGRNGGGEGPFPEQYVTGQWSNEGYPSGEYLYSTSTSQKRYVARFWRTLSMHSPNSPHRVALKNHTSLGYEKREWKPLWRSWGYPCAIYKLTTGKIIGQWQEATPQHPEGWSWKVGQGNTPVYGPHLEITRAEYLDAPGWDAYYNQPTVMTDSGPGMMEVEVCPCITPPSCP